MKTIATIVILNWNGWEDTLQCVNALERSDLAGHHLLVVDNGSTDKSVEMIQAERPDLHVLETGENRGYAGGMNAGIRWAERAGSEFVWLLNNDTTPEMDALNELVKVANADKSLGALSSLGIELDDQGTEVGSYNTAFVETPSEEVPIACSCSDQESDRFNYHYADIITGGSIFVRMEAIRDVGYLDESYFHYLEEKDLITRMRISGWNLALCCRSMVAHKRGSSLSNKSPDAKYYYIRNDLLYRKKFTGQHPLAFVLKHPVFSFRRTIAVKRSIPPLELEQTYAGLQATLHAIRGKRGKRALARSPGRETGATRTGFSLRSSGGRSVYVVFNEPLWSPLLMNQVVVLVGAMAKISGHPNVLVNFIPLTHLLKERRRWRSIQEQLLQNGSNLLLIPLPPFPCRRRPFLTWRPWDIPSPRIMSLAALLVTGSLALLRKIAGTRIIHARGYIATRAIRPEWLKGVRVIFDTRSPFPEEGIAAQRWDPESELHHYWKEAEHRNLLISDVSVAISASHARHLSGLEPSSRIVVIPNNVSVDRFNEAQRFRGPMRARICAGQSTVVMAYVGSLDGKWNRADSYAKFYKSLDNWSRPHRLLFVVPETDHALTRRILARCGLSETVDFSLVGASITDVPKWLSAADMGLQFMDVPDLRIGVKVVEYLAASLPVITNENVVGAAELIFQEEVGFVAQDEREVIDQLERLISELEAARDRSISVARRRFDDSVVAAQYIQLYEELLV